MYHASPQLGLSRIMPRYSPKFGENGVFVSDSKESMLNSWMSWAMMKPDKTRHGRTGDKFERVALYTIRVPREDFEEAKRRHAGMAASAAAGSVGAWGWDVETFIPEDLMPDGYLTPTSVKVYDEFDVKDASMHKDQWKEAGKRPRPEPLPGGSKNPARVAYKELQDEIIKSTLKRGGRIAPQPGRYGMMPDIPDEPENKLKRLMSSIEKMARKTWITSEEEDELDVMVNAARELMAIPEKESIRLLYLSFMRITLSELRLLIREVIEESKRKRKKVDQNKDGKNDFVDVRIAQLKAAGVPDDEAVEKGEKMAKKAMRKSRSLLSEYSHAYYTFSF